MCVVCVCRAPRPAKSQIAKWLLQLYLRPVERCRLRICLAALGRVQPGSGAGSGCTFGSRKEKIAAAEDGKPFSRCEHRGERGARRVRGADEQCITRKQRSKSVVRVRVSFIHTGAPDDRRCV
eukprot:2960227-Prymnesium_polylepis.2